MIKYRGIYRIYMPIDEKGKVTINIADTYIKGKYKTEVYRYSDDYLAIYFKSNTFLQIVLEKLNKCNISMSPLSIGDKEFVYLFAEEYIDYLNEILKFQTKGKNISPKSKKTIRRLTK